MATLTIRNLDDKVKQALREQAARHGVSMEEEVRRSLSRLYASKENAPQPFTSAEDIMGFARTMPTGKPQNQRYTTLSHKELTDFLWEEGGEP